MTPFLVGFTDELIKTGGVSRLWRLPKSKHKLESLKITESLKRRGLTPEQGYRIQEAAYGAARRGKRKVRIKAGKAREEARKRARGEDLRQRQRDQWKMRNAAKSRMRNAAKWRSKV